MNKLLLLVPAACAAFLVTGCVDEPYYGRVDDRPVYGGGYGPGYYQGDYYGPGGGVDFYYEGGVPYSREYGPLVFRDDHYYYNRGGNEYGYERHDRGGGGGYNRGGYAANGYRTSGRTYATQGGGAYNGRAQAARSGNANFGRAQYGNGNQFAARSQPARTQGRGNDHDRRHDHDHDHDGR